MFEFSILGTCPDTGARTATFTTTHGIIRTPCFMPVGTKGTVKTLTPAQLNELGADILLANTYHLFLQPGEQLIKQAGGLHRWTGWDKPILTDSGGYQVFSLSHRRRILEDGVEFQNAEDGGKKHMLTPSRVMQIQADLGADIIMTLDECTPGDADKLYARAAMERTHRWAAQCKSAQVQPRSQALFPIIQGGIFDDLRIQSARFICDLDLPGIAIGGLSVGEPKAVMYRVLDTLAPKLPKQKPHYVMGVGSPEDLVRAVARGIDMFDCVLPTRLARTLSVFLPEGRVSMRNARFKNTHKPLQSDCTCYCCTHFTQSYLHHLAKTKEILGLTLMTIHNLHFILRLMETMREQIIAGTFLPWSRSFLEQFKPMKCPSIARCI